METVDLSHYDLKSFFSTWEIACLVAGKEPLDSGISKDAPPPAVEIVLRSVESAATRAQELFYFFLPKRPGDRLAEIKIAKHLLPSEEVRTVYKLFIDGDAIPDFAAAGATRSVDKHKFWRQDVADWLGQAGYKETNYFTKDLPESNDTEELSRLRVHIAALEKELADIKASNDQSTASQASTSSRLSFRHETDLLRLVAAVQARFLGDNYDPKEKDSRPSKDSILDWLKTEHGITSAETAKAVDRVAMPFSRGR